MSSRISSSVPGVSVRQETGRIEATWDATGSIIGWATIRRRVLGGMANEVTTVAEWDVTVESQWNPLEVGVSHPLTSRTAPTAREAMREIDQWIRTMLEPATR